MNCQCCNKTEANIRICDVEENAVSHEANVCTDCFALIKRYLFDITQPLMATQDVIGEVQSLIGAGTALAMPEKPGQLAPFTRSTESSPTCPECGMTLSEFRARGRFGCPRDYEVFAEHLEPLFERIHDVQPARHAGRLPEHENEGGAATRRRRLLKLKRLLETAVAEEDFEKAAELRDEIQALESPSQEEQPH